MPQVPGYRFTWLGPYTSHWLTAEAEELVRFMDHEHSATLPEPRDTGLFARHRDIGDPLLCGCASEAGLRAWFGDYLPALQHQGAHVAAYAVDEGAIVDRDDHQLIFIESRAELLQRQGRSPVAPLVRSSAGSRLAVYAAHPGKYDYIPGQSRWQSALTSSTE